MSKLSKIITLLIIIELVFIAGFATIFADLCGSMCPLTEYSFLHPFGRDKEGFFECPAICVYRPNPLIYIATYILTLTVLAKFLVTAVDARGKQRIEHNSSKSD